MNIKVSVIIPVREINDYIRESIPYILKQTRQDFEIIIFPDSTCENEFEKTRIIPTGPVGPAEKRDLAIKYAEGEILAFLDDDAFPAKDWLKNALINFEKAEIAAVGGPAVTPENDNIWQKASGTIFETLMGGSKYSFRYVPGKKKFVDDFPSVNLLVRKNIFEKVGGFDSHYWPGEDTKLCLDITKKLGLKIIYDPEVLVWHHRRELFIPHLKQIGNYALHRGKFAKEFPETSFRLSYFIPSIFLIFLIAGGIISYPGSPFNFPFSSEVYLTIIVFYIILVLIDVMRLKNFKLFPLVCAGIFSTHLWYGFMFIIGLIKKDLKR